MSNKAEAITRQVVGQLISVLHGDYSDTRDLAVVQLVLFGEKIQPYLIAYLRKEENLEKDLIEYAQVKRAYQKIRDYSAPSWFDEGMSDSEIDDFCKEEECPQEYVVAVKDRAKMYRFWTSFKEKWGYEPENYTGESIDGAALGETRRRAVEGVLKVLEILVADETIPLLEELAALDTSGLKDLSWEYAPPFSKVGETITKILKKTEASI